MISVGDNRYSTHTFGERSRSVYEVVKVAIAPFQSQKLVGNDTSKRGAH